VANIVEPDQIDQQPSVVVQSFERFTSPSGVPSALKGFLTVSIPKMRIRFIGMAVFSSTSGEWVSLPNKPVRRGEGKVTTYAPTAEWLDRDTNTAFSRTVIEALDEFAPRWRE
jgi:hypothetical protein